MPSFPKPFVALGLSNHFVVCVKFLFTVYGVRKFRNLYSRCNEKWSFESNFNIRRQCCQYRGYIRSIFKCWEWEDGESWWQIGKNGRTLFDRTKPRVGCSANGRRRRILGPYLFIIIIISSSSIIIRYGCLLSQAFSSWYFSLNKRWSSPLRLQASHCSTSSCYVWCSKYIIIIIIIITIQ